ncbi:MAG: TPR repeat protein [Gammaproteobacteria bacterium]|jgi:TPR repeat protein
MVQFVEDRSSETQFELGQMYHKANTSAQDYEQAVKWYTQSAKQGYRRAQHRLGAMYAKGLGVAVNYIKAYAWCKVSASQQSRRAILMLKKIEQKMSEQQIAAGRKLSKKYYEMYVAPFAH